MWITSTSMKGVMEDGGEKGQQVICSLASDLKFKYAQATPSI